jgi:hypothetical protein
MARPTERTIWYSLKSGRCSIYRTIKIKTKAMESHRKNRGHGRMVLSTIFFLEPQVKKCQRIEFQKRENHIHRVFLKGGHVLLGFHTKTGPPVMETSLKWIPNGRWSTKITRLIIPLHDSEKALRLPDERRAKYRRRFASPFSASPYCEFPHRRYTSLSLSGSY